MTITNIKSDKHHLWWLDEKLNQLHYAGVAFYEEKYGEYRLKIDFFHPFLSEGQSQPFYLRAVGSTEDKVEYRAEIAIKKDGKFSKRVAVGRGERSTATDGNIHVNLGPFDRKLVVSLA